MSEKKQNKIEVTSPFVYAGYECNNRCIFCFELDPGCKPPKQSFPTLIKEVDAIREKYDFINFMGQEPTLRKDIIKLIAYAQKKKFNQIGITTNGRMFVYLKFAKHILDSGLNQIVVTVAGHNSKIHDAHTLSEGSFKQTLAGLKNILSLKNERLSLVLNIMVTQRNYKYLDKIVDFYVDLGIKEMNIGHIMPLNEAIAKSKNVIAKMSDVKPFLEKSYQKHSPEIKLLFVEYPPCILSEECRLASFPCLEENTNKQKIPLCQKCDYTDTCVGVQGAYLELYGSKEFTF